MLDTIYGVSLELWVPALQLLKKLLLDLPHHSYIATMCAADRTENLKSIATETYDFVPTLRPPF